MASTRPAVVLEQLGLEEAALGDARRRVLVPGLNEATVSITNRIVGQLEGNRYESIERPGCARNRSERLAGVYDNTSCAGLDMVDACTVDSAVRPRIRKGVRTCPPLPGMEKSRSASALSA